MIDRQVRDRFDRGAEVGQREPEGGDRSLPRFRILEDPGPRSGGLGRQLGLSLGDDDEHGGAASLGERPGGAADERLAVDLEEGLGAPHSPGSSGGRYHTRHRHRSLALFRPLHESPPGKAS